MPLQGSRYGPRQTEETGDNGNRLMQTHRPHDVQLGDLIHRDNDAGEGGQHQVMKKGPVQRMASRHRSHSVGCTASFPTASR